MATGDNSDLISRLQRWLPQGWFPSDSGTRIYAIVSGVASLFSSIYAALAYVVQQTRLASITDGFLDLASYDFFDYLTRLPGEFDSFFSMRIRKEVFRDRVTRGAIDSLLFEMTGQHPAIFEPERGNDCFAWRGRFGWRTGHYSSRAYRPSVWITTTHAGQFGIQAGGWRVPSAAWRIPTFIYTGPPMVTGTGFTDTQILQALERIRAAGVTYWVNIQ